MNTAMQDMTHWKAVIGHQGTDCVALKPFGVLELDALTEA
jgi:hypothetical protein